MPPMKKLCLIVFLLSFFCSHAVHGQQRSKRQIKKVGNQIAPKPLPANDTPTTVAVKELMSQVSKDTAQVDSTVLEVVAAVVFDSLKAQVNAPIIQVPVTLRSLIVPGALFAYGAITLNSGSLRVFNEETNEALSPGGKFTRPFMEDYLLLVPAAAVYGLNIFGVQGQNNLLDRSVIYGMSNLIANGIIFGVKQFGIEMRPDSSDKHSFPSGHTAEAFVSAEFLRQEYRGRVHWSVIAGGYAVAVGVGYLRMYHNKHWLSDVVAGAGIGIASTRFSYYLYPAIKHLLFGSRTVRKEAMLMPTYKMGGGYGLAFTYRF